MGLDTLVTKLVRVADKATKSLQITVSHYPWTGSGIYSEPTYGTVVSRKAVMEFQQRLRKLSDGQEIVQKASLLFVGPIAPNGAADRREPFDPRDKIVLPNGYTGPILDVSGPENPAISAPFTFEVLLG